MKINAIWGEKLKNRIILTFVICSIAILAVGCSSQKNAGKATDINVPTQIETPSSRQPEEKTVSTETSKPVKTNNGLKCEVA